jgi:hypothetical protein
VLPSPRNASAPLTCPASSCDLAGLFLAAAPVVVWGAPLGAELIRHCREAYVVMIQRAHTVPRPACGDQRPVTSDGVALCGALQVMLVVAVCAASIGTRDVRSNSGAYARARAALLTSRACTCPREQSASSSHLMGCTRRRRCSRTRCAGSCWDRSPSWRCARTAPRSLGSGTSRVKTTR